MNSCTTPTIVVVHGQPVVIHVPLLKSRIGGCLSRWSYERNIYLHSWHIELTACEVPGGKRPLVTWHISDTSIFRRPNWGSLNRSWSQFRFWEATRTRGPPYTHWASNLSPVSMHVWLHSASQRPVDRGRFFFLHFTFLLTAVNSYVNWPESVRPSIRLSVCLSVRPFVCPTSAKLIDGSKTEWVSSWVKRRTRQLYYSHMTKEPLECV